MTIITIPADAATIVRSALLSELGVPASLIDDASITADKEKHPELFERPLADFDRYRAAVNVLGWSEPDTPQPVAIDLDEHRWAITTALKVRLEVEHDYMNEDLTLKGARRQRRIAARNARIIERFVAANGLAEDRA